MVFRNEERFIQEAIASALSQTVQDFELILVDDGSTDSTKARLESFQDSRIRYFKNPGTGLGAARQFALKHSRGSWVAIFDADDISLPDRLELSLEFAKKGNVLVSGQMEEISEEGVTLGQYEFFSTDEKHIRARLGAGYSLCHGASLYRAQVAREVGGYSDSPRLIGEDEDLFIRLAAIGPIGNLKKTLIKRRIHRGSVCTEFQKKQWVPLSFLFRQSKLREAAYFARLGKAALKGGESWKGAQFYLKSLASCPLKMNGWLGLSKTMLSAFSRLFL